MVSMASSILRREVLSAFKKLHQTRKKVFDGDDYALTAARLKINEGFVKNKSVISAEAVKELIQFANAVEHEMRTTIIQAREVSPGRYEARVREDIVLLENTEFDISKVPDHPKPSKKAKCCENQNIKP